MVLWCAVVSEGRKVSTPDLLDLVELINRRRHAMLTCLQEVEGGESEGRMSVLLLAFSLIRRLYAPGMASATHHP